MRKYILYTLLILLLVATATLAYGFYNAKRIRNFSRNAQLIQQRNDFDGELQEIDKYFQATPSKDARTVQEDTQNYKTRLQIMIEKTNTAQKEVSNLDTPRLAKQTSQDLTDYYEKAGKQAQELSNLVVFMNQIFSVSAVFQDVNEAATLDDIKNLITEAQQRSGELSSDNLPENLKTDGKALIESTQAFLSSMQEVATQRKEESQALDSAYVEFSKAEDQFSLEAENEISQMENLNPLKNRIDSELVGLSSVYFSLK